MMANEAPRCVKQLRGETRMKVLLTGELRVGGGTISCRVLDLSRGGACVESRERGRIGESILLVRGTLSAKGQIAWVRGRRFGIRFDAPIRATELLVQMSHSRREQVAAMTPIAAPPCPSN